MTEPDGAVGLNALSQEAAAAAFTRCCGAARWVQAMLARRPFASREALIAACHEAWAELGPGDFREAFAHHPEIAANLEDLPQKYAVSADLSSAEQSGARGASADTLRALRDGNQAYRARFGYVFMVSASGKSAEEMRELLEARLSNSPERELDIAAAELFKITRLRLERLEP